MSNQDNIRQQITNQIIDSLKIGNLPPWRMPWSNDPNAPGMHTSLSSGNSYRGINQLILQNAASRQNYQSKWWGTYKQIQNSDANVRKGEKGTKVILWKPVNRKQQNEQGKEVDDSFLIMREFCVFNAEQTTGLDQYQVGFVQSEENTVCNYEQADTLIHGTDADIRFGGNEAYYLPDHDYIQCPFQHQFNSPESFYETLFHELIHWTENTSRLNWDRHNHSYAMGELIAEIGCCFLMGELGLPTTQNMDNHAAYIKGWLKAMNDDPKFIFTASSQATKAVDFILSRSCEPVTQMEVEKIPF